MERPSPGELFERHHLAIFRFLRNATGRADVAEDLAQEVFTRVIRGLESYEPREREVAWLFQIARRLLLDHGRAASRRLRVVPDPIPDGESDAPRADVIAGILEALGRLPEVEREAFLLREQGGLGYAEIAEITGGTPDAVRNRIHRARMTLREILSSGRDQDRGRGTKELRS